MLEWDPGPASAFELILEQAPLGEYATLPAKFRLEWGPIYYRGRMDGSARVLVVGQDPAADECVARRCMVGGAGQRVQRFLAKLGLTHSYLIVNSVLYCIYGQYDKTLKTFNDRPAVKAWRHRFLDALATPQLEAIITFGLAARDIVLDWPGSSAFAAAGRIFHLTHPTARDIPAIFADWNRDLPGILAQVSPDPDGQADPALYSGTTFKAEYLARIPRRDFGFGAPAWMGTGNMATRFSKEGAVPAAFRKPTSVAVKILGPLG